MQGCRKIELEIESVVRPTHPVTKEILYVVTVIDSKCPKSVFFLPFVAHMYCLEDICTSKSDIF